MATTPTPNPNNYRFVHYIATRVLNAEELMTQQSITRGMDQLGNPLAFGLNAIYRDGALMNTTASLTGTTVSFRPIDATKPMMIFCRNLWEPFTMAPIDIGSTSKLYLNYAVVSIPQPDNDAEMAQLELSFSTVSANGPPNTAANELERNTNPISVLTLVAGAISIVDLVYPQAKGTGLLSGLVQLTTNTSEGMALASDDPAVTNERVPTDSSIATGKVIPVTTTGLNVDNSPKVDPSNVGGIDSKRLTYAPGTNTVEGKLTSLAGSIAGVVSTLSNHIDRALGPGVHPMPNYADVGAAPISHVGADLTTAHDPEFTSDTKGFVVTRDPLATNPPPAGAMAYLLQDSTGTRIAGIGHNGDVFSTPANASVASPLTEGGDTPSPDTGGPLGLMSVIAAVLAQHVNKTSHKNPHGLTLSDLNGVDLATLTAAVANAIAVAEADVPSIVEGMFHFTSGSPGSITFPTSPALIVQWGQCASKGGGFSGNQSFNHFPTACFAVLLSNVYAGGHTAVAAIVDGSVNQDGFNWCLGSGSEVGGSGQPYWLAIGI